MDLPIVLSHKTAWLYHNVERPFEPLSRASSLYDEDSLANEAEPTAGLPKLGLDAKGLRASTAVGIVTDYLVSLGIPREEPVPNDCQSTATHLSLSPMSRDRKRPGCRGASGPLLAT